MVRSNLNYLRHAISPRSPLAEYPRSWTVLSSLGGRLAHRPPLVDSVFLARTAKFGSRPTPRKPAQTLRQHWQHFGNTYSVAILTRLFAGLARRSWCCSGETEKQVLPFHNRINAYSKTRRIASSASCSITDRRGSFRCSPSSAVCCAILDLATLGNTWQHFYKDKCCQSSPLKHSLKRIWQHLQHLNGSKERMWGRAGAGASPRGTIGGMCLCVASPGGGRWKEQ